MERERERGGERERVRVERDIHRNRVRLATRMHGICTFLVYISLPPVGTKCIPLKVINGHFERGCTSTFNYIVSCSIAGYIFVLYKICVSQCTFTRVPRNTLWLMLKLSRFQVKPSVVHSSSIQNFSQCSLCNISSHIRCVFVFHSVDSSVIWILRSDCIWHTHCCVSMDGQGMAFIVMARFTNPLFVCVRVTCLKYLATVFHCLQKSNSCKVLQVLSADKFLVLKLFSKYQFGLIGLCRGEGGLRLTTCQSRTHKQIV